MFKEKIKRLIVKMYNPVVERREKQISPVRGSGFIMCDTKNKYKYEYKTIRVNDLSKLEKFFYRAILTLVYLPIFILISLTLFFLFLHFSNFKFRLIITPFLAYSFVALKIIIVIKIAVIERMIVPTIIGCSLSPFVIRAVIIPPRERIRAAIIEIIEELFIFSSFLYLTIPHSKKA